MKELEKNSRKKKEDYNFYELLLQVTVGHHAMMYNIKDHLSKSIEEVQYLDDLGSFMDYNTYLETGFILRKSLFSYDDTERKREMTVLDTNFKKNLFKIK
jgi:hypothetical protein